MRRRILILFGGRSAEHEVSCISARAVMDALDRDRYEAVTIGIDRAGGWHLLTDPPALPAGGGALPAVAETTGSSVDLSRATGELLAEDGSRVEVDVVFPLLHGPFGEDGTVQGLLELAGLPYVGAGVLASAVGLDKAVQKTLFAAAGLPVVPHLAVHERDWEEDADGIVARAADIGFPLFAKPATLGSSVGITKVADREGIRPGLEEAFAHGPKALLERAAEGAREIECGVLGNDDPVASVPGEIIAPGEFYDYEAKYLDDATRLVVPAELPAGVAEEMQRMAVAAFRAIDCAGMARVDFFFTEPTDIVVNEINTIPGFTPVSMFPLLWEASGVPYAELIDRLVELALERHERERKRKRSAQLGSPD